MDSGLRRSTLILVASLAVMLLLYYFAYYGPHARRVEAIHGEIIQKREEIDRQSKHNNQLAKLHSELAQLDAYNQQMKQRIPDRLNVREFLATVHELAQSADVTISKVTPQIGRPLVNVQEQAISLTLTGAYHRVIDVLHRLESMPQELELIGIEVKRPASGKDGSGELDVRLDLRLFAGSNDSPMTAQIDG
jgi:Tfp pilus assembly protein PilO